MFYLDAADGRTHLEQAGFAGPKVSLILPCNIETQNIFYF